MNTNLSEPLHNILLTDGLCEAQTCNKPLSALIYNSEVNTDCVQWQQKNDTIHMCFEYPSWIVPSYESVSTKVPPKQIKWSGPADVGGDIHKPF